MAKPKTGKHEEAGSPASARAVWTRVRAERIELQVWPPVIRKGGLLIKKAIVASALAGVCFGAGMATAPQAHVNVRAVDPNVAAELSITGKGLSLSIGAGAKSLSIGEKAVEADKAVAEAAGKISAARQDAVKQAEVPGFLRPPKPRVQAEADGPAQR